MTIKRVNRGKSHSYIDTDTGQKVPGVTTIISDGLPKPALINWAANATAEAAVDRWDEFAQMPPSARLKALQKARYEDRDAAANRGTAVHDLAERLVRGERVTVPEEITGHVQSYVSFLDAFDVQPVLVERTVYSPTHGYCGTCDLVADLLDPEDPERQTRIRMILDIKTNRSGIFGDVAAQIAAYRYADFWIDDDGTEMEMPEVDMAGAVHVRADGYDLIPIEAGSTQHRQFLYMAQVAEFVKTSRDLVGQPFTTPESSTYRLTREGE